VSQEDDLAQRAARLPLAELVRAHVRQLLDTLGPHRLPRLHARILAEAERALLEEALRAAGGVQGEAAEILGLHRNGLRLKLRRLGLAVQRPARVARR
jgi:Fis family transcriptional regulator, factor for inversion stimulation protein